MTVSTATGAPPLSVAQEALWYTSRLEPNRISYNETISIRKDGPFDAPAFRRAFNAIVERHEAWRSTFELADGHPVQVVHPPTPFALPVIDLSALPREQAQRRAVSLVSEASSVPYDLRRGPLLRPRLMRFAADHHRLYLGLHHLVFDGVSVYRVVLPQMIALYDAFHAGRPDPLPRRQAQYADYARWEQQWIIQHRVHRRIEYWRRRLSDPPVPQFPNDQARPAQPRLGGGVVALEVSRETVAKIREVGRGCGATLFQVLAATWSLLLSRYSGQSDVIFATAADLRQRPELETVVGYCVTPLVVRVDLRDDPQVADLVVRIRNELLDGLENLVPFERVVRDLGVGGSPGGGNPIYRSMLVLEPAVQSPDPTWSLHQMESEIGNAVGSAKLDLELELDERPDGHLAGRMIYDRDLLESATVAAIAHHWRRLLTAVVADPSRPVSRLPILTAAEESRQLVEWNATATEHPDETVHDLIRTRWRQRDEQLAVSAAGRSLRYGSLHRAALTVAVRLRAAGVRTGEVVALVADPSPELVAATLGVLRAGGVHLLLDPGSPAEVLDSIIADARCAVVLADPALAGQLTRSAALVLPLDARCGPVSPSGEPIPAHALPDTALADTVVVDTAACGLGYRSNEHATPRGALVRHATAVNLANAIATDLSIDASDAVLILPSTLQRAPVMALWMPLITGARVVLAPADAARHGSALSKLIVEEDVTLVHAAPSEWELLIASGLRGRRGLRALSGGAPLSRPLAEAILDRCQVLWNAYGAAEAGGYCTVGRIQRSAPMTIGRPIANMRAYVLDAHDQPVPAGVFGELVLAGDGIADGYVNRARATGDDDCGGFGEEPGRAGRAFRTGDRARWLRDGLLQLGEATTGEWFAEHPPGDTRAVE